MLNKDIKDINETPIISEKLKKAWDTFHRYALWVTLFLLVGVAIGVKVSKVYYTDKITEIVKVGAFLHDSKVYQITPK